MIMMIKRNDDLYQLLMQHPKNPTEFGIVSVLNKKDYDFMLDHFRSIRVNNDVGSYYIFPRDDKVTLTITRLYHRGIDDYVVDGNFFAIILSEMIGVELDLMIFELENLPHHQVGTPAYFPPSKERINQ